MFAHALVSRLRSLFGTRTRPTAPRTARLGLDTFEDRVVPASVSFQGSILIVHADDATDDTITIVAAGKKHDGTTGVTVTSNIPGVSGTYDSTPVTKIALDLKGGNDTVNVASLVSTSVYVGEWDGANSITLGDVKSATVVAGSGQNNISLGGGTLNENNDISMPGYTAGTGVFLGWRYIMVNDGSGVFTDVSVGNNSANVINLNEGTGQFSLVHIFGSGNNQITDGRGNTSILIEGDGSNTLNLGVGVNVATINGNGNNSVTAGGTGSVTVSGSGTNTVDGGRKSGMTVSLNGAGPGSSVRAATVFLDGTAVTADGVYGNVTVNVV